MSSIYKNLANDTVVFAIGNMLTKAIQFFLLPMYTVFLSTEQYGIGELVNNLSELLYPICCLGVYEGVFRYAIEKGEDERSVFSTGVTVALAFIPFVIVLGVVGHVVAGFDYAWLLVALCLVMSIKAICLQFAKGINKTRLYAASGVVGAFALFVFGYVFLGAFQLGTSGYLYALVVSHGVQLLIVVIGASLWRYFSPEKVSRNQARMLLAYSLPMIPNALAWWFVNLSGRYVILLSQGAAAAGLFTAASKLPSVMIMLVTVFQQAWQIFSARQYESADRDGSFGVVFQVYSILLLCSGSLIIALAEVLSSVMLSGEFFEAHQLVPALMLGAVVNGYSVFFGTIYNAAKKNGMIFATTIAGAAINIVMGLALVNLVGVWGPILSSVIAYSVISLSRAIDTRKFAKFKIGGGYQLVGILVLVVEVVVLSIDAPFAMICALGISAAFIVGSAIRYRSLLARMVGVFIGKRG